MDHPLSQIFESVIPGFPGRTWVSRDFCDLVACSRELTDSADPCETLENKGSPAFANLHQSSPGTCGICHQGTICRRVFDVVGGYSTDYQIGDDYEHDLRCYIHRMNAVCITDILAEYDVSGSSNDHGKAYAEFTSIHRRLAPQLPWPDVVRNEVLRNLHHARVSTLKFLARSPIAPALRPPWLTWNRLRSPRTIV
jgi:hypothetical protein